MSEATLGLLALFSIALVCAAGWHAVLRSFLVASLLATVTAVVLFQLLAYVRLGHLDPFFWVAVALSSVACLLVSLLVGWVFQVFRRGPGRRADAL